MNFTVYFFRWFMRLLFLVALSLDRPSFSVEALSSKVVQEKSDVSFSSIPLSWTGKYGSLPISRKELINELQGLGRKAAKLHQSWKLRAGRYSSKKTSEARKQNNEDQTGPIVIPVNPSSQPEVSNSRLAFLQLRDCVFVGSGCASPRKMDANQTSKYMDQMEAIYGAKDAEINTKPMNQRNH